MTTTTNIELGREALELQELVAKAQVIGAQAYYESTGGITRDELRAAAAANGLDIVVAEPAPEGVFRQVVRAVAQYDRDLVARVTRDDDVLTYAIARVTPTDSSQVGDQAGEIVNRVLWRKVEVPGQPRFAFMVQDDVATAMTTRFDDLMRHMTADELRDVVGRSLKAIGGIKLLGRLWFVGLAGYGRLLAVRAMLREVGVTCHVIPTLDLGDSQESMAYSARRQVWKDIRDLLAEVEQWKNGGRSPRKATLETRLETYKDLRDSVETMADVLALQADDLRVVLEDMQAAAMAMLDPDAALAPQVPRGGEDEEEAVSVPPEDPAPDSGADSAPAVPSGPVPPARPCAPAAPGLDSLTMSELRRRAKEAGIRPGKMDKVALVATLQELSL